MRLNKRFFKYALLFTAPFLLLLIYYAPFYLMYKDTPGKSQVIVLFLGPAFEARKQEAYRLLLNGYADYLIIPAYNQIFHIRNQELIVSELQMSFFSSHFEKKEENEVVTMRRLMEGTHLELLHAREMMDKASFRSAIFVSSPYHMRRLKLIGEKLLDKSVYTLFFVPSSYETVHQNLWLFYEYDRSWIIKEYAKMFWFFLYTTIY
ncbi:MAG TPA: ElyC/SanA/YdcF family protein [Thermodesulfovibrionia bacterium]|nr:ElyC/SanA/YdcF family protein [Thermodesulfovibrionia bacterium]